MFASRVMRVRAARSLTLSCVTAFARPLTAHSRMTSSVTWASWPFVSAAKTEMPELEDVWSWSCCGLSRLKHVELQQSGKTKKLTAILAGSEILVKGSRFLNDDEGDHVGVVVVVAADGAAPMMPWSTSGVSLRTSATLEHSAMHNVAWTVWNFDVVVAAAAVVCDVATPVLRLRRNFFDGGISEGSDGSSWIAVSTENISAQQRRTSAGLNFGIRGFGLGLISPTELNSSGLSSDSSDP